MVKYGNEISGLLTNWLRGPPVCCFTCMVNSYDHARTATAVYQYEVYVFAFLESEDIVW